MFFYGLKSIPGRALPFLLCAPLMLLASCGETSEKAEGTGTPSGTAGFEATITGAYKGEVSGDGVLKWLPGAGSDRQGSYFLADGQGLRPHGVTFSLPPEIAPGKHELQNPPPFESGTVPSVRVDRDLGNATASADRNTSGYINILAFPEDPENVDGTGVTGDFEFDTEDREGRRIRVKGKFSFKAGE